MHNNNTSDPDDNESKVKTLRRPRRVKQGPEARPRPRHRCGSTNRRLQNMALQNEGERGMDESTSPTMDAAKRADNAVRDTARTYLRKFGVNLDLEKIEQSVRDKPLPSAAIAAAAGFIIGGGMATRPAVVILALFGRKAAKETATNFMTGMVRARTR